MEAPALCIRNVRWRLGLGPRVGCGSHMTNYVEGSVTLLQISCVAGVDLEMNHRREILDLRLCVGLLLRLPKCLNDSTTLPGQHRLLQAS